MNNSNTRTQGARTQKQAPKRPSHNKSRGNWNRNRKPNNNNRGRRPQYNNKGNTNRTTNITIPRAKSLKVCTLSGTTEIGRNCNFLEFGDDIIVVDFGLSFPGQELLGVDYTIPNAKYLKKNKDRIKAILITHGHLDHTGGLPFLIEELGFPPIYAGRYANALIKERLKEYKLDKKVELIDVHRNKEVKIGVFDIKFIGVTHSIPNSFSIFVQSPEGNVFLSGDYKMDPTPANEEPTDKVALKALQGKVDLALMESTNPESDGAVLSDKIVAENLEKLIVEHDGRVVVSAFASLVSRLYSLVKIAEKHGRKVFISGRSLQTAIRISSEQRYIEFPENILVSEEQLSKYPDEQILFICTGSQGERYAALNRMSLGEHKYFKIKEGDLILMSSSEIPGNIGTIERMTDRLIEKNATLVQSNMAKIHGSGHGLKDDMKLMYELVQPKTTIPIHGSLTKRYKNRNNLLGWGAKPDSVHLTTDGAVWTYVPTSKTWKRTQTIDSKPILIDGLGVGDISEVVIKDRQQLSQYGMVTVILNLSSKSKHLLGNPKFISRGFVYVKHSRELMHQLEKIVKDIHKQWLQSSMKKNRYDTRDLTSRIEKDLKKFIYKKIEREPMILPMII